MVNFSTPLEHLLIEEREDFFIIFIHLPSYLGQYFSEPRNAKNIMKKKYFKLVFI